MSTSHQNINTDALSCRLGFIAQSITEWRWRVLTLLLATLVISLIGVSRIYLEAHYLSDVLGAIAVGVMWLSFSATALEIDRRYRASHQAAYRRDSGRILAP